MHRRYATLLLLAAPLAACNEDQGAGAKRPPTQADASDFRVAAIGVGFRRPEQMQQSLETINIGVTNEIFAADMRAALSQRLVDATKDRTRKVRVGVTIESLTLGSTVPALVRPSFVSVYSEIYATVTIEDARTGEVLLKRVMIGDDNPGQTTFGGLMKDSFKGRKTAAQAYKDTVNGFAEDFYLELILGQPHLA